MPEFSFNPNELQQLNRLIFAAGRAAANDLSGSHRNRRTGEGIDFLDYRPYTAGDDFRKIDWNLYGRMRQLFVRLYEDPRQLAVTLLVDVSRSMSFGAPLTKLQQAQRLACALGFIGLRSGDRVFGFTFADGVQETIGPLTSARSLSHLVRFLSAAQLGGQSNLLAAVRELRTRRRHRGLIVILSDYLNVPNCEEAISMLVGGGGRVLAIQILDPLDRGQGLSGVLRLRDSENDRMVDVTISQRTLSLYRAAFEERRARLEALCRRLGQHYLLATTADAYLNLVGQVLRSKAVVI